MATLTEALRAAKDAVKPYVTAHIDAGERTLVNGHELHALWEDAQPNRVQMYVSEAEWGRACYSVALPTRVEQEPWLAVVGASVYRVKTQDYGVIKKLDHAGDKYIALVVLTTEV